jgi:hypothetical protein
LDRNESAVVLIMAVASIDDRQYSATAGPNPYYIDIITFIPNGVRFPRA